MTLHWTQKFFNKDEIKLQFCTTYSLTKIICKNPTTDFMDTLYIQFLKAVFQLKFKLNMSVIIIILLCFDCTIMFIERQETNFLIEPKMVSL